MVKASVIILTTRTPTRVLECLKKQTFQDFEVIIASEEGIVNAMNLALGRARGEILVRIDDDVDLPPTWLGELLNPFSDPIVAGVTGPTFVPKSLRKNRDSIRFAEKPNTILRWLYDSGHINPGGIRKCGCPSYDSNFEERLRICVKEWPVENIRWNCDHLEGTNWAMRTHLIREVGGFDTKFDGVAEWFDTDVEFKIKKLGYKLRYNPYAYLLHLLEFTEHYKDRFDGWGRIKNWLRFHYRHSKFHPKMVVFLIVWIAYFIGKGLKR